MSVKKAPEYACWRAMRKRCLNPREQNYPRYGGAGVRVCERWASFEAFKADVGPRPSPQHSLDRFPNALGNYEPGNVRWATKTEQSRNRPNRRVGKGSLNHGHRIPHARLITVGEITDTMSGWDRRLGLGDGTVRRLMRKSKGAL